MRRTHAHLCKHKLDVRRRQRLRQPVVCHRASVHAHSVGALDRCASPRQRALHRKDIACAARSALRTPEYVEPSPPTARAQAASSTQLLCRPPQLLVHVHLEARLDEPRTVHAQAKERTVELGRARRHVLPRPEHVLHPPVLEERLEHVSRCVDEWWLRRRVASPARRRVELARRARPGAESSHSAPDAAHVRPRRAISDREARRSKPTHKIRLSLHIDPVAGAARSSHALRRAAAAAEGVHNRRRHARLQTAQQLHVLSIPIQHALRSLALLLELLIRRKVFAPTTSVAASPSHGGHNPCHASTPPAARPQLTRPPEKVLEESHVRGESSQLTSSRPDPAALDARQAHRPRPATSPPPLDDPRRAATCISHLNIAPRAYLDPHGLDPRHRQTGTQISAAAITTRAAATTLGVAVSTLGRLRAHNALGRIRARKSTCISHLNIAPRAPLDPHGLDPRHCQTSKQISAAAITTRAAAITLRCIAVSTPGRLRAHNAFGRIRARKSLGCIRAAYRRDNDALSAIFTDMRWHNPGCLQTACWLAALLADMGLLDLGIDPGCLPTAGSRTPDASILGCIRAAY